MKLFTLARATRDPELIVLSPQKGAPVRPSPVELVRLIQGVPDWLAPLRPSVHSDAGENRYRVRSSIAPCVVSDKVGPACGMAFFRFKRLTKVESWLNANPDWPTALLYAVHANYVVPSGGYYHNPLGDQVRDLWTEEQTALCAGWKFLRRI